MNQRDELIVPTIYYAVGSIISMRKILDGIRSAKSYEYRSTAHNAYMTRLYNALYWSRY